MKTITGPQRELQALQVKFQPFYRHSLLPQYVWVDFIPLSGSLQQFMELEPEMLATETIVPVYFALEDDELLSIYAQTLTSSSSQGSLSAAEGKYLFPLDLTCSLHVHRHIWNCWFNCVFFNFSSVLLHTATANGFQMVTSGAQSKAISDWAITSLEVRKTEKKRSKNICSFSF